MNILGIESSFDETAAAVVSDGCCLKSNIIASSMDLHSIYGGVIPEIAARSHLEVIIPVIRQALDQAECTWDDIDAIAVTYGAGLSGSLLIGVLSCRTLALIKDKPLVGINHVEAHVYANFITESKVKGYNLPIEPPAFPFLAVIVSGGHSQLVLFKDYSNYTVLGKTQDDAIGEAFDKVAKILGLPYPGGKVVSELAKKGDPYSVNLPLPSMPGYDFSYSGLKTAVLRQAQAAIGESYDFPSIKLSQRLSEPQKANIAASFERVAALTIVNKVKKACFEYMPKTVVLAGGVAANQVLRRELSDQLDIPVCLPDIKLCTDNGAMIATLGYFKLKQKKTADPYRLDVNPSLVM